MIRRSLLLLVAIVALMSLAAPLSLQFAVAQESTPMAGPELPPGVTAEFIGGAPLAELPANPGRVVLVRLTLEPGAILPPEPNDPTGAFVVIESGALATRSTGPLTVSRASEADFIMEPVATDTQTTLHPGDALYVGPFQSTEVRNDGDEPAVFLLVNILLSEGGEEAPETATAAAQERERARSGGGVSTAAPHLGPSAARSSSVRVGEVISARRQSSGAIIRTGGYL